MARAERMRYRRDCEEHKTRVSSRLSLATTRVCTGAATSSSPPPRSRLLGHAWVAAALTALPPLLFARLTDSLPIRSSFLSVGWKDTRRNRRLKSLLKITLHFTTWAIVQNLYRCSSSLLMSEDMIRNNKLWDTFTCDKN